MECCVGIMQGSYFGLGAKDYYSSYSCVVAPIGDGSSSMNATSDDVVPARMLDVRTGNVTSITAHANQLQQQLTRQEISFLKLRCIIMIIASSLGDIQVIERIQPIINL